MRLDDRLYGVLEQYIRAGVSGVIIKRGWHYYTNECARQVKATAHATLTGVVQGSDLYAVVLDAEHFKYSSCTCPFDGYCKHMAAVYFQYTEQHEGSREGAEQAYFRMLGLTTAGALATARVGSEDDIRMLSNPGRSGGAEQWLTWMEREHGEMWKKCRHSLHALQPVLSGLKGLSRDWEKSAQRLHWILSVLFVLEQGERAIDSVDSFSRYYHEISFSRMAEPWLEQALSLIAELNADAMQGGEWEWAESLAACARRRAMLPSPQLFDWTSLYTAVWERLSGDRERLQRELELLESELTGPGAERSELRDSFLHTAAAMLRFYRKEDRLAIGHFADASFERSQRMMYLCADKRIGERQWELAELWMAFLNEKVGQIRNARNVGPFLELCRAADEKQPEEPRWTLYMTELLPYSYRVLSEHWLNGRRYGEWADLQLFIGTKPEDIAAAELRAVAKGAPDALLPLYHLSIEASIRTRSRQGYRGAVKGLKKLERLYKALKQSDRWDGYVAELADKHRRLRAFQEELWKGNIVT